jgi:hypothetical protein
MTCKSIHSDSVCAGYFGALLGANREAMELAPLWLCEA